MAWLFSGGGCCPCPVCDGRPPAPAHETLRAVISASFLTPPWTFDLDWNETDEEWQSGNFEPDCEDVYNVKMRCSDGQFQISATNDCGLNSGWVDATKSETECQVATMNWTASGCSCTGNGARTVTITVQKTIRSARKCCACVCDELCATLNIPGGGPSPGFATVFCQTILNWPDTCSADRWTGTFESGECVPTISDDIDVEIYFDREDGECVICLESECLGLTGDDVLCVPFTPDPTGEVRATFPGIDFTECLSGLSGSGIGSIELSCDCQCCYTENTLTASFADVRNCEEIGGSITLNYDSDSDSWVGSGDPGCGVTFSIEMFCEATGDGCAGMRMILTPNDCGGNAPDGELPDLTFDCNCDPFEATWDFGVPLVDCTGCCPGVDGFFKAYIVTITE